MNTTQALYSSLLLVKPLVWQSVLERTRVMVGLFQKVQLIILDGLTKEMSIASYLVAKQIIRLTKQSGYLFTALYLKLCATALMMFRGGTKCVELSVPVSLTGSGLPRIIHRKEILRRSERGDILIQFDLSLFSLSKRVSRSTFSSIVDPPLSMDNICEVVSGVKELLPLLIHRYCPWRKSIPLE